jgi:hypothetical protein
MEPMHELNVPNFKMIYDGKTMQTDAESDDNNESLSSSQERGSEDEDDDEWSSEFSCNLNSFNDLSLNEDEWDDEEIVSYLMKAPMNPSASSSSSSASTTSLSRSSSGNTPTGSNHLASAPIGEFLDSLEEAELSSSLDGCVGIPG